jgi:hypothetical protein
MRNLLVIAVLFITIQSSFSQFEINPQVGLLLTRLSNTPENSFEASGRAGWLAGLDLRFGETFYLQPGAFFTSSRTYYKYNDNLTIDPQEVSRTSLKVKAMVGFKLLNTGVLKLRVAAGPTYEFQTSLDDIDNEIINKDNYNKGNLSIDAAAGINILFLTLDIGYSFGLSDVYKNSSVSINTHPKYQSVYLTAGIQF